MCTEATLNNIWIILDQFTCCMGFQTIYIYIVKFKARTDIGITEKAFFLVITLINQVWRLTQFTPAPSLPPPQHFFKEEEISFDYLPWREGGSKKLIKGVKVWCRRRSSEKGGWHFSYLIFSRFITFIFTNYFTLRLCIWKKTIFFCLHNFIKKGHSKLSKMNLKISHKLR